MRSSYVLRLCVIITALLALTLSTLHRANAQSSPAVHLVGHIDPRHGVSYYGTYYSSCWGWAAPDGREYALLGAADGTSIIDLNRDSLVEVGFIPGPPSGYAYREIKTYKHYAYVVSEGGNGVQIIDLAGLPDSAVLVKNFIYVSTTPPDSGKSVDRSHTVTIADGYLYCNGSAHWSPNGSIIFSLREDPVNPIFMGTYEPMYIHDSYVRHDTLFGAAIYNGGGLFIADVSDKSIPLTIGKISYSGSGTHNAWVSINGAYAFTTDEIGVTNHDMKVWALDSLPNSVKVAEWSADPTTSIHNVHGRGNYVYVAHYKAGMRVVDVHDPINPVEAGFYDTYTPEPDPVGGPYAGCWGVYPYFPSGKWIGSDMQTGLYVCTFDSLKPRKRPRLLDPPDSSLYRTVTTFRWTSVANQAEDPHVYDLHLVGQGMDTTVITSDTTAEIRSTAFQPEWYTWDVTVRDEFTEVSSVDTFRFYQIVESVEKENGRPARYSLKQNYPNPFNPLTKVAFELPASSHTTLEIYDLSGRRVAILLNGTLLPAGKQEVVFDATTLPSGAYFYRLETSTFSETKKMLLVR